uniref:Venom peptide Os4a n=1 Tax=Oncocephalus sp. TaxID=2944721 RepID=A0AB38ZEV1_9HEMI
MKFLLLMVLVLICVSLCLAGTGQGIDEEKVYPDWDEPDNEDFGNDFIDPEFPY